MPSFITILISLASLVLIRPQLAPPPPDRQHPPAIKHAAVSTHADLTGPGPDPSAPRRPASTAEGSASQGEPDTPAPIALFETADRCLACHNGVTNSAGQDVSIGFEWRASMMANSARDPYWQAAVRREITDHPEARELIEDKCATCHMPMARYEAHLAGGSGEVFGNLPVAQAATRSEILAADGVSCSACHQITEENLGDPASFTGGFQVDETTPWGQRIMLGPFETDRGRAQLMNSATGFTPREASHIQASELCASCHTLYTESLDEEGNQVGELPEQVPYLEWRHSSFADPAEGRSCQSCHMPVVDEPIAVTGVLGQPRDSVNRHVFRGGNFFVLGMLNRYRNELGTAAMPQEMDASIQRTLEHLRTNAATLTIEPTLDGSTLSATVTVTNLGGHKLPTAYPSRRAWLHVSVRDATGGVVFESGAFEPTGAVVGNDNDRDPSRFEPHYERIDDPEQVQIYESIMADVNGDVTTGLLSGYEYVKDNRVPPDGFDKATADPDIAVHGNAAEDADFTGGSDRIVYAVDVAGGPGPFTVDVELWYQPISYRWAHNLEAYDTPETNRFVRYYGEMSDVSGTVLARASATVE